MSTEYLVIGVSTSYLGWYEHVVLGDVLGDEHGVPAGGVSTSVECSGGWGCMMQGCFANTAATTWEMAALLSAAGACLSRTISASRKLRRTWVLRRGGEAVRAPCVVRGKGGEGIRIRSTG